jgi:hypothetical protein
LSESTRADCNGICCDGGTGCWDRGDGFLGELEFIAIDDLAAGSDVGFRLIGTV